MDDFQMDLRNMVVKPRKVRGLERKERANVMMKGKGKG